MISLRESETYGKEIYKAAEATLVCYAMVLTSAYGKLFPGRRGFPVLQAESLKKMCRYEEALNLLHVAVENRKPERKYSSYLMISDLHMDLNDFELARK